MNKIRASLALFLFLALLIGGQGYRMLKENRPTAVSLSQEAAIRPGSDASAPAPEPSTVAAARAVPANEPADRVKWRALEQAMATDDSGLAVRTNPDGSRTIDLAGRFTHVSAAVRGPDGRLRLQCFTDYNAMSAALTGEVPTPQASPDSHETFAY